MIHSAQSEASCLLQTGALYQRRIGLMLPASPGDLVFAGFKSGAFSLYFGDEPIYHFDLEGRWQRAYLDGKHYLKALDTTVQSIDRVREGRNMVLKRRTLDAPEAAALDQQIRGIALGLIERLKLGEVAFQEPPADRAAPLTAPALGDFLQWIARWDEARWAEHRERHGLIYGEPVFLPPDSLNAIVLQATRGAAEHSTFTRGSLQTPQPYSSEPFAQHCRDVRSLWGDRMAQARVVFLAGENLLGLPRVDLFDALEQAASAFPLGGDRNGSRDQKEGKARLDGVHLFVENFPTPGIDLETLKGCRERHLSHVTLGIESGSSAIRARHGKSWKENALRDLVANLRAAEIGLSILTLAATGTGEEDHVRETASFLASLELARGDTIFLVDERDLKRTRGMDLGQDEGTGHEETASRQQELKEALAPLREKKVKVLPYLPEKQGI